MEAMVSILPSGALAQLAQVNVAVMRGPLTSEVMQRFTDAFDPVMRIAEQSPGFLWRLRSASGHATVAEDDAGAQFVVNVSVWTDYTSLHAFVFRSGHGGFLRRRSQWFLPTPQPSTALWWVLRDERPTVGGGTAPTDLPAHVRPVAAGLLPAAPVRPHRRADQTRAPGCCGRVHQGRDRTLTAGRGSRLR
jgi:hypothetical protein